MDITLVYTLFDDGIFSALYKSGFITNKLSAYRDIYNWVHNQVEKRGITKNQAVLEAELKFECDERTIWRALNSFS